MKKIIVILFLLISPTSVFACPAMPAYIPNAGGTTWRYDSKTETGGESGTFEVEEYVCSMRFLSLRRYYGCSCASYIPPPGSPFQHDPNNPAPGVPPGSPADPDNGGPGDACECTVEVVCYNENYKPVYYELLCCDVLHVYGSMDSAVFCTRTDEPGTGPPIAPGEVPPLIRDPDSGWDMPQGYAGPPGDYVPPANAPPCGGADDDGDGIPNHRDLEPNGLEDGSDNPRWRETGFTLDSDGNKVGGTYEVEGREGQYSWGDTSPAGGRDYVPIGGGWNSPESFGDGSGTGWTQTGGGGGGTDSGTYDPYPEMALDPANPTDEEIANWETYNPPAENYDPGESTPDEPYEAPSGSSGDPGGMTDADLSELAKFLEAIEEDQRGYGAENISKLEEIIQVLERIDMSSDSGKLPLDSTHYTHTHTYFDAAGNAVGFQFKVRNSEGDEIEYLIGEVSDQSHAFGVDDFEMISSFYDSTKPWNTAPFNGTSTGDGTGTGLTGDDLTSALASDRGLADVDADAERTTQEANVDLNASPTYDEYVSGDIPLYDDEKTEVTNKTDALMTTSGLSDVRDSVGVECSGSVSSLNANIFGANIVFDFSEYEYIYNVVGLAFLSLCYLLGFFMIFRS